MNIDIEVRSLEKEADWVELARILGGKLPVVDAVIAHLLRLNVVSYLIESKYIDRDYSSDYRHFYAQTFKTYPRHCIRIHFFAEDARGIIEKDSWKERIKALKDTSGRSYRGFCVVRPLPHAPIGRTALTAIGPSKNNMDPVITCRADVDANLMGARLKVKGACFMQQDQRVGACAQVSIWTGARHMHQRYGYNWLSVADITKLAAPTTSEESIALPAGSEFLTSERMIKAVNEMGFQPLCFRGSNIAEQILPYVDSGLPVILGLNIPGAAVGHAVTIVGRVFQQRAAPEKKAVNYVSAFIVHDDQAGPYKLISVRDTDSALFDAADLIQRRDNTGKEIQLVVEKNGVFAMALMPIRAFSTAAAAEEIAKDRLTKICKVIDGVKQEASQKHKLNPHFDEFLGAFKNGEVILRTYLSSADGYRRYLGESAASDALKDILMGVHLPHFTWVTEFSTGGSFNHASSGLRRIYGHCVVDATSSRRNPEGALALHLPGMVFLLDVNAPEGSPPERALIVTDDQLYAGREKR